MNLTVTPEDFEFLKVQRGDLDHLSLSFDDWVPAYNDTLRKLLLSLKTALPENCGSMLDIGSGMGGIDAMIYGHYASRGQYPTVHLLDGEADEPRVLQHDKTFNSMARTLEFLHRNGVEHLRYSVPKALPRAKPFDLIVSFAAWCFHIPPLVYLDYVVSHCHANTVLILDVRRHSWQNDLLKFFDFRACIYVGKKYNRMVLGLKRA